MNKIYNESNLETMARMPDEFIDLVITSPPYDGMRTYNGYSFPFEQIAKELHRVLKKGGVIVWIVGDQTKDGSESGNSFRQALFFMEIGFNLHDTMIYHKETMPLTHNRYEQHFEYMFVLSKGKPKTFNPITEKSNNFDGGRVGRYAKDRSEGGKTYAIKPRKAQKIIGNVWKYKVGGGHNTLDKIAFNHPAIFPEKLCADHIKSWSNEGDLIYDPFGGSGTTAKMAQLLKRNWILSEISGEYVQIARKRIEPYLIQTTLF